ncbi:MAG: hypothetical protein AB7K35_05870 [Pseudorhodoplanes sp.]
MDRRAQFRAGSLGAAAVAKDGSEVTIEFEADNSLLWVTLPVSALPNLQATLRELEALAIDARNGVANRWHVVAPGRMSAGDTAGDSE